MKYIKYTYVDAITGVSVASHPAANGPVPPAVVGLQFVWARESLYPTDVPQFFGTCPDESNTQIDGVLGVFVQSDWDSMRADEMLARVPSRRITRLAFDNRFTQLELRMLELESIDDPASLPAVRALAADLRVNQRKVDRATFIDLDLPQNRIGTQMLEAAGLLAAGRALEILDAPITPEERPL